MFSKSRRRQRILILLLFASELRGIILMSCNRCRSLIYTYIQNVKKGGPIILSCDAPVFNPFLRQSNLMPLLKLYLMISKFISFVNKILYLLLKDNNLVKHRNISCTNFRKVVSKDISTQHTETNV